MWGRAPLLRAAVLESSVELEPVPAATQKPIDREPAGSHQAGQPFANHKAASRHGCAADQGSCEVGGRPEHKADGREGHSAREWNPFRRGYGEPTVVFQMDSIVDLGGRSTCAQGFGLDLAHDRPVVTQRSVLTQLWDVAPGEIPWQEELERVVPAEGPRVAGSQPGSPLDGPTVTKRF